MTNKQLKISNQDFFEYIDGLKVSELKGLNYRLEIEPMPLTYSINGDSYIMYLQKVERKGQTLIVNNEKGEYYDEDGFLENENEKFTWRSDRKKYNLKGYNFGSLNFSILREYRVQEI